MTGESVFITAMALLDEINENTGLPDPTDTNEYKQRSLPLINTLIGLVAPYSDTYRAKAYGARPRFITLSKLEDTIALDEVCCATVLPHGLASLLIRPENEELANAEWSLFLTGLDGIKNIPQSFDPIADVYGIM